MLARILANIADNLLAVGALAVVGVVWGVREHLGLAGVLLPIGKVRVSYSALLRIRSKDRCVLFQSNSRPETYGPPGGVFKYDDHARPLLDRLEFHDDKWSACEADMRGDLRGKVPARSLLGFIRWFKTGAGRESAEACLRRELQEELTEVELAELIPTVDALRFVRVRTITEVQRKVRGGGPARQVRRFELYDLEPNTAGQEIATRLTDAGDDPGKTRVCCADRADISYGRCGTRLIAAHTPYLNGGKRLPYDIPPLRLPDSPPPLHA